jgi:hypothetical protein
MNCTFPHTCDVHGSRWLSPPGQLMPLDSLQERIIRAALALPESRTLALAGGCAVITQGLVDRITHDVDLFTEVDADEATRVCAALRAILARDGLRIEPALRPPHENRFVAVDPASGDRHCSRGVSGRRAASPADAAGARTGPAPDDLAADKTLALWGRAEPRDYLDVITLRERYGSTRLLELAAEKDRGFTVETFIGALQSIRRLRAVDWADAGIDEKRVNTINTAVKEWLIELDG